MVDVAERGYGAALYHGASNAKGKYIIMGELRPSEIYTDETSQKRYMIVDETGKIVCYAVPNQSAAQIDVDKLMHCKVGLEGKMLGDLYNTVRVVKFSNIEELASEEMPPRLLARVGAAGLRPR